MLTAWMMQHLSKKWSEGLRFVQCMKNRAIHQGTKISSYEAMFGTPMKVGLQAAFPLGAVDELHTEEDLQAFLEEMRIGEGSPQTASQASPADHDVGAAQHSTGTTPRRRVPLHILTGPPPVRPPPSTPPTSPPSNSPPPGPSVLRTPHRLSAATTTPVSTPRFVGWAAPSASYAAARAGSPLLSCCQCGEACSAHDECSECGTGLHPCCAKRGKCGNCSRSTAVLELELRATAEKNLRKQAATMLKISDAKFPPASVGDTVVVPVA
ncbi:uncharacterized protein LOC127750904 [Frankliniella occidentalis]|uniref:Uncharacterized protein LOC127750904 n=1 Tax=Frankliniella occidentalis TaxID=133901 RepID=A0A9C6X5H7_FRAOC|nr:uncharacterized protein LOC127750904 [Frankliniella occidentalis]